LFLNRPQTPFFCENCGNCIACPTEDGSVTTTSIGSSVYGGGADEANDVPVGCGLRSWFLGAPKNPAPGVTGVALKAVSSQLEILCTCALIFLSSIPVRGQKW
jgi:hypothetical protein